jgi:hypothetical protein
VLFAILMQQLLSHALENEEVVLATRIETID